MERHQYDFGLIGNCAFTALIDKNTNVKWMCVPRFDSSFIFGSLVAGSQGGEFSIKPEDENYTSSQKYLPNTNILQTQINREDGSYRITDFAPRFMQVDRYYRPMMLIRKIEPLSGMPKVKVSCTPVADYGKTTLKPSRGSNHLRFDGLDDALRLTTNIPLTYITEEKSFHLRETAYLVLTYGVPLEAEIRVTCEDFLDRTTRYWQKWVKSTSIGPLYQKEVLRSALVLKICQYEDTGAMIAAPTTSLPESPGSGRNWDYRYCWMRDTYYILNAFNNIGHFEEMEKYFAFITNIPLRDKMRIQPLYGIGGEQDLTESELDLPGYMGNKPVRVGNDAYTHIQNDVYGQLLLAIQPLYVDERFIDYPGTDTSALLETVLEKIEMTIDEEDAGIWEFRHLAFKHAYSNLFQWAGSLAAVKIAKKLGRPDLAARAEAMVKKASGYIEDCYLPDRNAYARGVGDTHMDASTLQLIVLGYIPHDSDLAKSHLAALEEDLKAGKGLFYRYREQDDFGEPEATFIICGFWYAEALACVGRIDEAKTAFEEIASYANHLGLLSEDVDEKTGSMWGNFPQAYSHLGLINAAARINQKDTRSGAF